MMEQLSGRLTSIPGIGNDRIAHAEEYSICGIFCANAFTFLHHLSGFRISRCSSVISVAFDAGSDPAETASFADLTSHTTCSSGRC